MVNIKFLELGSTGGEKMLNCLCCHGELPLYVSTPNFKSITRLHIGTVGARHVRRIVTFGEGMRR